MRIDFLNSTLYFESNSEVVPKIVASCFVSNGKRYVALHKKIRVENNI